MAGIAAVASVIVGLAAGLPAAFYAATQYYAQEERWSLEDQRIAPTVEFKLDDVVTVDGWRHAVVGVTNRFTVDLQVDALEAVTPDDLYFAEQRSDDNAAKGPVASAPTKADHR